MSPRLKREKDQLCICFTEPKPAKRVQLDSTGLSKATNKRALGLMMAVHDLEQARHDLKAQMLPVARDIESLSYEGQRNYSEASSVEAIAWRIGIMRDKSEVMRNARERIRLAFAGISPAVSRQISEAVTINGEPVGRWWTL